MSGLENIRIVLVETSHPGNIGAAARAMKTMGLDDLVLVNPKVYPHADATAMASGADDLLGRARVVDSLAEAVGDCVGVYAMTARQRTLSNPPMTLRDSAVQSVSRTGQGRQAWVFGRERTGLTNEEVDLCTQVVHINANPEYSSLNLAAAVQVAAYELRVTSLGDAGNDSEPRSLPPAEDIERLYAHLEKVLVDIDFLDPDNPRHLMRRLRNLFSRAELDVNELNILRGVLAHVEKRVD